MATSEWKKIVKALQNEVDESKKEWRDAKEILAQKRKAYEEKVETLGDEIRGGASPLFDAPEE